MSCDNFRKFHRNNPMVFHRVVELTNKLKQEMLLHNQANKRTLKPHENGT